MDILIRSDENGLYRQLKAFGHGPKLTNWLYQKLSGSPLDLRMLSIGPKVVPTKKSKAQRPPRLFKMERHELVSLAQRFINEIMSVRRPYENMMAALIPLYVSDTPNFKAAQVLDYILPMMGVMLRVRVAVTTTSVVIPTNTPTPAENAKVAGLVALLKQHMNPLATHANRTEIAALKTALSGGMGGRQQNLQQYLRQFTNLSPDRRVTDHDRTQALTTIDKLLEALLQFNTKLTFVIPNADIDYVIMLQKRARPGNAFSAHAFLVVLAILENVFPSLARQVDKPWKYAMAFVLYAEMETQLLTGVEFKARSQAIFQSMKKTDPTKQLEAFQTSADILLGPGVVDTNFLITQLRPFLYKNLYLRLEPLARLAFIGLIHGAAETLRYGGWNFKNPTLFVEQETPTRAELLRRENANEPTAVRLRLNRSRQKALLLVASESMIIRQLAELRQLRHEATELGPVVLANQARAAAKKRPTLEKQRRLVWNLASALVHTALVGVWGIRYAAPTQAYLTSLQDPELQVVPFKVMKARRKEVILTFWQKAVVAYLATYLMHAPHGGRLASRSSQAWAPMFAVFVGGKDVTDRARPQKEAAEADQRKKADKEEADKKAEALQRKKAAEALKRKKAAKEEADLKAQIEFEKDFVAIPPEEMEWSTTTSSTPVTRTREERKLDKQVEDLLFRFEIPSLPPPPSSSTRKQEKGAHPYYGSVEELMEFAPYDPRDYGEQAGDDDEKEEKEEVDSDDEDQDDDDDDDEGDIDSFEWGGLESPRRRRY